MPWPNHVEDACSGGFIPSWLDRQIRCTHAMSTVERLDGENGIDFTVLIHLLPQALSWFGSVLFAGALLSS
jgi:hypothetical protein